MASARHFFGGGEAIAIENSEEAELKTSEKYVCTGELLFWKPHWRGAPYFNKLGMNRIAERNGVLFYIVKSHKNSRVGRWGIHQKLGEVYWNNIIARFF